QQQGAAENTIIGLFLERGLEALLSILAVMRLGATYLPLDPAYPLERLAFMIQEAQPPLLLTHSNLVSKLPAIATAIHCIDQIQPTLAACPQTITTAPAGSSLAYIMYTSGSTGKPKGVQMPRQTVHYYIAALSKILAVQPSDIYLHTASFSFSSSVRQMLIPLSCGATMILASQSQVKNPLALLELMQTKGITISDTVPSVWRSLLAASQSLPAAERQTRFSNQLRIINLSGEITPCSILHGLRATLTSQPDIFNIYGSTETVGTCVYPVPQDFDRQEGCLPVGFPYPHNRTYILNEQQQPVAPGEVGELYVAGGCVSQGYLHRPDLTAQNFIPNPWVADCPEPRDLFSRLYKTGDVACQWPDGAIEVRGRVDFQVKLRGMRIELEEIEAALESNDRVKAAMVLGKTDPQGEQRLVAYVVPQGEGHTMTPQSLTQTLQANLRDHLPSDWIPSLFMPLPALPLTPNGKRDRLSVPAPDWGLLSTGKTSAAPQNETESQLLQIWIDLLGFTPGLTDDFFILGGHSLMAVEMFSKIDQIWGKKLAFNHLIDHPTIQSLAVYLRNNEQSAKSTIIIPLQKNGDAPPLFCIHAVGGSVLYYSKLLPYLPPNQPVYGIQARGFDGIEPPLETVEAMAKFYIQAIRNVYPQGPIYVIGHSFGGLVAYEIARQLYAQNDPPQFVGILDAKTPKLAKSRLSWRRGIKTIASNLRQMSNLERKEYLLKTAIWFYRKRKIAADGEYAESLKAKNANMRMFNVLKPNYHAQHAYEPRPYPGDIVVFRATIQSPRSGHDPTLGWQELVEGQIHTHRISGRHLTMLEEPHVQNLAAALISYLPKP
ncbi:MAG: amino acid adenylation domain-containing protein, partial [Spirulina sp. DLM2.Bin59]